MQSKNTGYEETKQTVDAHSSDWQTRLMELGDLVSTSIAASSSLGGFGQTIVTILSLRR